MKALGTRDQVGVVRGQPELRLQILGQEGVEAGHGQQVQHAAGRAEHEYVIAELAAQRAREVLELRTLGWGRGARHHSRHRAARRGELPREAEHAQTHQQQQGGHQHQTCNKQETINQYIASYRVEIWPLKASERKPLDEIWC